MALNNILFIVFCPLWVQIINMIYGKNMYIFCTKSLKVSKLIAIDFNVYWFVSVSAYTMNNSYQTSRM